MEKKETPLNSIDYYLCGNRLRHSIAVHKKISNIIPYNLKQYEVDIKLAALYHDIGYSELIKGKTGNHNIDGYNFIKNKVSPLASYLILIHSNGREFAEEKGLHSIFNNTQNIAWFLLNVSGDSNLKLNIQRMLNLLNYCDLTTNSEGKNVTFEERLEDIGERYGEHSIECKVIIKEINRLKNIKSGMITIRQGNQLQRDL